MKFVDSFAFATFVITTITIALPLRNGVGIDIHDDSSITESRDAVLDGIVERGITETVSGFKKRELEPAGEIHTRFIDDAENIYERSLASASLRMLTRSSSVIFQRRPSRI